MVVKQLSGFALFAMTAQCIDSEDKRKLLLKEKSTVFEAQRNDYTTVPPQE